MLARRFLYLYLLFILFLTACQDTSQTSANPSTPSPISSTSATPVSASNNSPTPVFSPGTSSPMPTVSTILKQEEIKVGAIIPEIVTKDASGKTAVIASRTDKKGELLMVYAPTCPICHETMPNVVNLHSSFFQGNNIPIIALSVQPQAITELSIKELNIPFQVVVMPEVDQKFGMKIPSIPTLIAVGPDGVIKGIWVGQLGAEQLTQIIKVFCPDCNIEVNKT